MENKEETKTVQTPAAEQPAGDTKKVEVSGTVNITDVPAKKPWPKWVKVTGWVLLGLAAVGGAAGAAAYFFGGDDTSSSEGGDGSSEG